MRSQTRRILRQLRQALWRSFAAAGLAAVLLNALGTGSTRPLDVLGVVIRLALTVIALVLAKVVPAVPSSIWVLALATIASAPFVPTGAVISSATQNINVDCP